MLRSFDDVSPITIRSNLKPPLHAEWSNSRKLLAIAGTKESSDQGNSQEYTNLLKFYSVNGILVYTTEIPYTQVRPRRRTLVSLYLALYRIKWFILRFFSWLVLVSRIGIDMGTQRQATLRGDRSAGPRRMGLQVISHFDFSRSRVYRQMSDNSSLLFSSERNEVVELFFTEELARFNCCRDWRWEQLSRGNQMFNIFHYRRDWEPRWPPFSLTQYGKKKVL